MKHAQTIPWNEIEKKYAKLFSNKKDNVAKSLCLGLSARIIQAEHSYSDAKIPLYIQENLYLQSFCGYKAFGDCKSLFDSSMMVYFRKSLTPEIIELIMRQSRLKMKKLQKKQMTRVLTIKQWDDDC